MSHRFEIGSGNGDVKAKRLAWMSRGLAELPDELVEIMGEKLTEKFLQFEFQMKTSDVWSLGMADQRLAIDRQLSKETKDAIARFRTGNVEDTTEEIQKLSESQRDLYLEFHQNVEAELTTSQRLKLRKVVDATEIFDRLQKTRTIGSPKRFD